MDAQRLPGDFVWVSAMGVFSRKHRFASAKLTETRKSSSSAWISHLPEVLIHKVLSIFIDVFPPLACTRSGLPPRRADNSRRAFRSDSSLKALFALIRISFCWLRQD